MSAAPDIIDINWVELFSCCTNVTTMQAIGRGTSSLVRALTAPTVTNAGPGKERRKRKHKRESTQIPPAGTVAHTDAAIFPKLMFLGLSELPFSLSEGKHPSGTLFNIFKRGLQQRMAASGAPLKLLHISDCGVRTKYANSLQVFVQDLHVENKPARPSFKLPSFSYFLPTAPTDTLLHLAYLKVLVNNLAPPPWRISPHPT